MKIIKQTSLNIFIPINWILLLILVISCGQVQTNLEKEKVPNAPIFVELTATSLIGSIDNSKKGKEIKLLFDTNLPTSSILTIEAGETINTTTRAYYFMEKEISIDGSSFEFVMNDTLVPAYIQLRIHKNRQNPEILSQLQTKMPKNLPVPLGDDASCLFQTIYLLNYKWKDNGKVSIEYVHDFLGAIR